ncbi:hypothetical protein ABIF56_000874 [Bradyrhizobium elkanii]
MVVTLADAGDEERLSGGNARRIDVIESCRDHGDRLLEIERRQARCRAHRLGRDAEMVAKRAGECFVGAVIRIQREAENIGRTGRELARGFAEPARPHITHHREPGRLRERPHQMEARDARNGGNLVERQRRAEMAFDVPERLLGWIHGSRLSCKARPSCTAAARGI